MPDYSYPLTTQTSLSNAVSDIFESVDGTGWFAKATPTTEIYDPDVIFVVGYEFDVHAIQYLDAILHWLDVSDETIVGSRIKFTYRQPPSGGIDYRLGYSDNELSVAVDLSGVPSGSVVTVDAVGTSVAWSYPGSGVTTIDISGSLADLSADQVQQLLRRPSVRSRPLTPVDLNIIAYPTLPAPFSVAGWSVNDYSAYIISTDTTPPETSDFWTEFKGAIEAL